MRAPLGFQHYRGMVLPFAVGCAKSRSGDLAQPTAKGSASVSPSRTAGTISPTATFHVANIDGCSSLLKNRGTANFRSDPKSKKWKKSVFALDNCVEAVEQRVVPCVDLDTVIGEWFEGRTIEHLKIDAQGFDLEVLKSAGGFLNRLKRVQMEMTCENAAKLYEGERQCAEVVREMEAMGFRPATSGGEGGFGVEQCQTCTEISVEWVRGS